MNPSYIGSLFFTVTYGILFINILRMPKCKKTLYGAPWICITFILTLWVNTMLAALMSLVHIPISLFSMGVAYILVSGAIIYFYRKKCQQYIWDWLDIVILFIIAIIVIRLGIKQHGTNLQISYLTSDPGRHLQLAMDVVKERTVNGMFYAPLNNGLFISLLSPFLKPLQYYKSFILADIIMLYLAGAVFYSVIREGLHNRGQQVLGAVAAIIYMLGYPLNNKLFGFVYLGMAVTIIAVMIYISKIYIEDDMEERLTTILLMLGCNAVVMCYMLFAPVVFVAVFMVLILKNKKNIVSVKGVIQCLEIFLLPCILAVWYCYIQYFLGQELKISTAIAANGVIYGEVYANFVFFLPIVIFALIRFIKDKRECELILFFGIFLIYMAGLLACAVLGKASYYYFFKVHHVVWMIVYWIMVLGIMELYRRERVMLVSYGTVIVFLVFMWLSGANDKIIEQEAYIGYVLNSDKYFTIGFDVFRYNKDTIEIDHTYSSSKMKLYAHALENKEVENKVIPIFADISNYEDCYWYEAITMQDMSTFYVWNSSAEAVAEDIFEKKSVPYTIILYSNPLYEEYKSDISKCEKIYENDAGCIIKIADK